MTLLEVLRSAGRINDVPTPLQFKPQLMNIEEQAVQDFTKLQNLILMPVPELSHLSPHERNE